jgi:hypothetical protein
VLDQVSWNVAVPVELVVHPAVTVCAVDTEAACAASLALAALLAVTVPGIVVAVALVELTVSAGVTPATPTPASETDSTVRPVAATGGGAAIVAAAGLYNLHRERVRRLQQRT